MVWDESNLVIQRENARIITEATLLNHAVHGILSDETRKLFYKNIEKLNFDLRMIGVENEDENEDTPNGLPRLTPESVNRR